MNYIKYRKFLLRGTKPQVKYNNIIKTKIFSNLQLRRVSYSSCSSN